MTSAITFASPLQLPADPSEPTHAATKHYVDSKLSGSGVVSVCDKTGVVVLDAVDVGAVPVLEKGVANGVATLDGNAVIPISQLPVESTLTDSLITVPTSAAVKQYVDANACKGFTTKFLSATPGYAVTTLANAVPGDFGTSQTTTTNPTYSIYILKKIPPNVLSNWLKIGSY